MSSYGICWTMLDVVSVWVTCLGPAICAASRNDVGAWWELLSSCFARTEVGTCSPFLLCRAALNAY